LCLWPRDQKSAVWVHRMGLVASNYLRTFVFVSGEPVSEAHIRTAGVGQIRRTTSHEKQAIGFSLLYDHAVCVSCIMHINYRLDAVLVLHTRTASLVDTMEDGGADPPVQRGPNRILVLE
jgi:hypothetical protein